LLKGNTTRRQILAAILRDADEAGVGWASMLKTKKFLEDDVSPSEDYAHHLKSLKAGGRVEITYADPQRGGTAKTLRVVSMS